LTCESLLLICILNAKLCDTQKIHKNTKTQNTHERKQKCETKRNINRMLKGVFVNLLNAKLHDTQNNSQKNTGYTKKKTKTQNKK
jgi:DNA-binding IscR family transcriptional regulator